MVIAVVIVDVEVVAVNAASVAFIALVTVDVAAKTTSALVAIVAIDVAVCSVVEVLLHEVMLQQVAWQELQNKTFNKFVQKVLKLNINSRFFFFLTKMSVSTFNDYDSKFVARQKLSFLKDFVQFWC